MRYLLRNKNIGFKKVLREQIYAATIKIFKAGKVFVNTIQRVNMKMLITVIRYNRYLLMILKTKGVF